MRQCAGRRRSGGCSPRLSLALAAIAAGLGWAAHAVSARRFERRVERRVEALATGVGEDSAATVESLPEAARDLAARSIAAGRPRARTVSLRQSGSMWLEPGGKAVPFEARHVAAVRRPGFLWDARLKPSPLLPMRVIDAYVRGRGSLEGRLFGSLPVICAEGAQVSRGELMRYLAELPWYPEAMLDNPHLEWRELESGNLEVAIGTGGGRVSVNLELDDEGLVSRVTCNRPRRVGQRDVSTPWVGLWREYRWIGGLRVPTIGEAAWKLESGWHTYWRGRLLSLTPGSGGA